MVLRSQPGGTGIRNFGSWSVRVGMSDSGADTDWHFSALGLLLEHPAAVTVTAVASTAASTGPIALCLRICFPSKPATAYRRAAAPP